MSLEFKSVGIIAKSNDKLVFETVRSLLPEIAARAPDCEALRRLPDETAFFATAVD